MRNKIGWIVIIALSLSTICYAAYVRPKGPTRFQSLSAQKAPIPSLELDTEYNNLANYINNFSLVTNTSEWFDPSTPATWISATTFNISGNHTAEFTAKRRIRATLAGGDIYSEVVTSSYSGGANLTTVTIANSVLTNPISKVYFSILNTYESNGAISVKMIQQGNRVVSDLTGNVIGNVTGHVTGNVFGNISGNVRGNLRGNVFGNASSATNAANFGGQPPSYYMTAAGGENASGILTKLKTVDGIGSGLDAELLRGVRTIYGVVNYNATIAAGTGFYVSGSLGYYTVTWATPFSTTPIVLFQYDLQNNANFTCDSITSTSMHCINGVGSIPFSFFVIGI